MVRSPLLLGVGSERAGATRIGAVRIVVGATALLANRPVRSAFGLSSAEDTSAVRVMARLFGGRNVLLGMWTLLVRDDDVDARRICYQLNAAADIVDVAALVLPLLRRQDLVRFRATSTALGVSATLAWLELLGRLPAR